MTATIAPPIAVQSSCIPRPPSRDAVDMWPTSARCVDVSFPTKIVNWIVFYPTEGAALHGYREIEIWAATGEQYSDNTCANKLNLTPTPGGVTPPSPEKYGTLAARWFPSSRKVTNWLGM